MNNKTLNEAFELMFHQKFSFEEFISCDIRNEIKEIQIDNRTIVNPSEKLRKFHKFLNLVIFSALEYAENSVFSYKRGASVVDSLLQHKDNKFFFQTDISNFFQSITSEQVDRILRRDESFIPISDIAKHQKKIINLVTIDEKLPLGFSTSPKISNSVLLEFDKEISLLCKDLEYSYTRYSDDIIISSKNNIDKEKLELIVNNVLASFYENTFQTNKHKTKVQHTGDKVKILGLTITPNGKITLDSKHKNKIESSIHFFKTSTEKFTQLNNKDFDSSCKSLSGLINYANSNDKEYIEKLRKKYGSATVDYFIHLNKDAN